MSRNAPSGNTPSPAGPTRSASGVRLVALGVGFLGFLVAFAVLLLAGLVWYVMSADGHRTEPADAVVWGILAFAVMALVACFAAAWGLWQRRAWARLLTQAIGLLLIWNWLAALPRAGGGTGGTGVFLGLAAGAAVLFLETPGARAVFGLAPEGILVRRPAVAILAAWLFVLAMVAAWMR